MQENEMMDPELDYTLMRVCKQMIKRFCPEVDSKNMLQCLKQNKNSELMDPKCKQMITKRQITQNTDYRLNPVLRKACKADIPKFCQDIISKPTVEKDLEGLVISCLKRQYADQDALDSRLGSDDWNYHPSIGPSQVHWWNMDFVDGVALVRWMRGGVWGYCQSIILVRCVDGWEAYNSY
nr:PREDICTED: Golgi apparatus protein 1-like [Latimeria chalumnae]|eukprot:XP_006012585.2 PREDICTED: Golgi apparatus protein 1-like [Latimeria chalumnae]